MFFVLLQWLPNFSFVLSISFISHLPNACQKIIIKHQRTLPKCSLATWIPIMLFKIISPINHISTSVSFFDALFFSWESFLLIIITYMLLMILKSYQKVQSHYSSKNKTCKTQLQKCVLQHFAVAQLFETHCIPKFTIDNLAAIVKSKKFV